MLVFRVEDEDGLGPYWSWKYKMSFTVASSIQDHAPPPYFDKTWDNKGLAESLLGKGKFGFDTKDKLLAWFTGLALEHLITKDFNVAIYKSKKHAVSQHQTIFIPRTLLRKVSIKRFLWELENKAV